MKGVQVYHTIQVLSSQGFSIREISRSLDLSKSTVHKYLQLTDLDAVSKLNKVIRISEFDSYRDYLIEQLELFPTIRITKLYRKLLIKHPSIKSCRRSFHNYISRLDIVSRKKKARIYQPIETSPGLQVQVDPGEMNVDFIGGVKKKIYFVAFVFSFSRMKYVYFQDYPLDTSSFIKSHKEAFSFFGYTSSNYVYDQTKLVVIKEKYREVWLNEKFHQFALSNNFTPQVCEGYDPESKGKVERVVREVKEDYLTGEIFSSVEDIRVRSLDWLSTVNNTIHSTTTKKPSMLFKEEAKLCLEYKSSDKGLQKRLVDKTGLLSYKSVKYSVPEEYQQKYVNICEVDNTLLVYNIEEELNIATHLIPNKKGITVKNNNHYRNFEKKLEELKEDLKVISADILGFDSVVEKIINNNPKIIRDQLRALKKLVKEYGKDEVEKEIPLLLNLLNLTATKVENQLERSRKNNTARAIEQKVKINYKVGKSVLDRSSNYYDGAVRV